MEWESRCWAAKSGLQQLLRVLLLVVLHPLLWVALFPGDVTIHLVNCHTYPTALSLPSLYTVSKCLFTHKALRPQPTRGLALMASDHVEWKDKLIAYADVAERTRLSMSFSQQQLIYFIDDG